MCGHQDGARTQDVVNLVREIPGSKVLSDVGAELSFQLPLQESAKFPGVLAKVWPRSCCVVHE